MQNLSNQAVILAREGAQHGDCGKMCSGCAFRPGTEANQDEDNMEIATQALWVPNMEFYCHHDDNKLCSGYRYALQALASGNVKSLLIKVRES